jgi:curli biogenesis system outer membrane secretion channel CsgG
MPRRYALVIAVFLIVLFALSGCQLFFWKKEGPFQSNLKFKTAILPFEDSARFGGEDVDQVISGMLAMELEKRGRVKLTEWTRLEEYIHGQGIPMPLTPSTATLVGRSLGLNLIVLGNIAEISQIWKEVGLFSLVPMYIPYVNEPKEVVEAVLIARIIDVETGVVVASDTGTGLTKTGGTADVMGVQDKVDEKVYTRSMDEAVADLAEKIHQALVKAHWKGFIVETSGDEAVLNAGLDVGIQPGYKFTVFTALEKITNVAGQTYVVPGPPKAQLEAVEVFGDRAVLKVLSGQVHMGDTAQHTGR